MSYWHLYNPIVRQTIQSMCSPESRRILSTFVAPRIFVGYAATQAFASSAAPLLKRRRAFIVTDPHIKALALGVEKILQSLNFTTKVWDKVVPEPPTSSLKPCAEAMEEFGTDLIVAVGGGSVIDTAKVAWVLYERPDVDFRLIDPLKPLGLRRKALLAAIPTTSGTGSEATSAAVITDETFKPPRKFAVTHPELVPDIAVIDPRFVVGMPKKLTLGTALDALAHAADCYLTHTSFELTDALAVKAIKIILRWLPRVLEHPDDVEARLRMHLAATLAGLAFSNGGIGLTHSLGHALGKVFGVHHGYAVGVFIPYIIKFYSEVSDKYLELAEELGLNVYGRSSVLSHLIGSFTTFFKEVGAPLTLKELGISEEALKSKLDVLAKYAFEDPCTLYSPRPVSTEVIKQLFLDAMYGRLGG